MTVLVVNAGSSSLKYALVDDADVVTAHGMVERVGEAHDGRATHVVSASGATYGDTIRCVDHGDALAWTRRAFSRWGPTLDEATLPCVGHRVVHGGTHFRGPVVVDDDVVSAIRDLGPLAPLHNPAAAEVIAAARQAFAHSVHVAVFDTAFHLTLPPEASTYAVPAEWRRLGVRRYGAHGISHHDASERARTMLGHPTPCRVVVLHLGAGASACAVLDGRSVATSMGMTPLEGLVMGTRSGDLDPGVVPFVHRTTGISLEEAEDTLWHASGLAGLCGEPDFREVAAQAQAGDVEARLAIDVMVHRLRMYVGGYAALLGGLDALVFTGGIGEHSADLRAQVVGGLTVLGLELDSALNSASPEADRWVSTPGSSAAVLVLPAREEEAIARACRQANTATTSIGEDRLRTD